MTTVDEITAFLDYFKIKLEIWGILFHDREKNLQTLLDLELTTENRKSVLRQLKKEDYCGGPLEDKLFGKAEMWVFGKIVKGEEIYIKISLGTLNEKVICISFHIAEHPMHYPLKS